MQDIEATLVLTQEDLAFLWNGGTLAVKIDAPTGKVTVDVSVSRSKDGTRQTVRIKRIQAKRQLA